jgi:hypothetical protein
MSSIIQGVFLYGATPQDGATVRLWPKAAFADPGPAYDAAEPGSGQIGSDVTTGTNHGGTGAYRFTSVAEGDYWLSINHAGHRTWEAVHVGSPAQTIAPNSVRLGANATTSGTTELDVLSQTLTAPPVAGQVLLMATLSLVSPSAANDVFAVRLYVGGVERMLTTVNFAATSDRASVHISAVAPVSAASGQVVKVTLKRDSGTGTVTAEGNRCNLSWVIFPAAVTVA